MPYDEKNNPNNRRLHDQNTFGRESKLEAGTKVWRLFNDMRHSMSYGTVERTGGQGGKVYVRWQNGVAYQEDPLYLVTREDLPYVEASRKKASRVAVQIISDKLAKKKNNHKDDCACKFCAKPKAKEDKESKKDVESSFKLTAEDTTQYKLNRDGEEVMQGTMAEIYKYIHNNHSFSVTWATKHEGYEIVKA